MQKTMDLAGTQRQVLVLEFIVQPDEPLTSALGLMDRMTPSELTHRTERPNAVSHLSGTPGHYSSRWIRRS